MNFPNLTRARLMRRYKRFLADVLLPNGDTPICVHCPNTGAMTGCQTAESAVWLSHHDNPKRKLAWTWELVETEAGMACIHPARANDVVKEALRQAMASGLEVYTLLDDITVDGIYPVAVHRWDTH